MEIHSISIMVIIYFYELITQEIAIFVYALFSG